MLDKLFILGVTLIPFSGFFGVPVLGEMKRELSVYVFILALGYFTIWHLPSLIKNGRFFRANLLLYYAFLFFSVIAISFVANFSTIMDSVYRERAGINKFFTSSIVAVFGFAIAYLSFFVIEGRWQKMLLKPIAASVVICAVYSVIEVGSWFIPGLGGLYKLLFSVTHSADIPMLLGMNRLMSVSFEPPAFANYAGFAWPWIYAGVASSTGARKKIYMVLWAVLSIMMIFASSRTGIIVLAGSIASLILLRYIYLPLTRSRSDKKLLVATVCVGAFIVSIVVFADKLDLFINQIVAGDSVSNLSRFASNMAAFNMFEENPFFGFGFGQYGFHAAEYMPSWGWYSWEIRSWFNDVGAIWPPVFSIYARFAAELGALGVVAWILLWGGLMVRIMQVSLNYQKLTGTLPVLSHPLALSCISVLLTGIPYDSLRPPMMWITLGFSCYYIKEISESLRNATALRSNLYLRAASEAGMRPCAS